MTPAPRDSREERWIRPLPKQVINKIAAGEVVERPASVVKELVENSLDAGARRIEIIIEKSGTSLIKIIDDGCGIPSEQVEIAFSRHATSKITVFDDLEALDSYGFRGEALPSVASVSRLRMVSRLHNAEVGTEIVIEGGVLQSRQPIAAPPGTSIEVGDLFFNTPARRKFLKSESAESRYLSRVGTALAIGSYQVAFTLNLNNRKVFALPPDQTLGDRVAGLLAPGRKLLKVEGEAGPVRLTGFVSPPEVTLRNRTGLYLFVNGRYIQSPMLSHAVVSGYGELLLRGNFPVGAVLLEVDPEEVDVNVHPSKTEVRLSNEREIHSAVHALVKQSLRGDSTIPSFKTLSSRSASSFDPNTRKQPGQQSHVIPGIMGSQPTDREALSRLYRPPEGEVNLPDSASGSTASERVNLATGEIVQDGIQSGAGEESGPSAGFRLVGRFSDLYLLLQSGDDLFIVDQHTAHERVLFEECMQVVAREATNSQQLLFPAQVELSPDQLATFTEVRKTLKRFGFVVSDFGGRMVNIEAAPTILRKGSVEQALCRILDDLGSRKKAGVDTIEAIAQSLACRSAVMAGDRLSDDEAVALLRQLLQCENGYCCPHGRPTFVKMSKADIDKQFGRG